MTYTYVTLEEPIQRFELKQGMTDPHLTRHPETGVPIKRIITGGNGFNTEAAKVKSKSVLRPEDYMGSKIAKEVYKR